jgi:cell wall-associated NlpC family hydrolase
MLEEDCERRQRAAVVAAARRWIGTPYHSGADVPGVGVDCGMLIVRVFVDAGLTPAFDPRPYACDWHLHRSEELYLGLVGARCAATQEAEPGDLMLFRWGRCYSHGAVVTRARPLSVVHAFQPAGLVVEEPLARNARLAHPARRPLIYSFWGRGAS